MTPNDPLFYPDHADLMVYNDSTLSHPVRTPDDWLIRRGHILENFQKIAGPLPKPDPAVGLDMQVLEDVACEGHRRLKVTFAGDDADRLSAYLLLPLVNPAKAPAMLCPHPTDPKGGKNTPAGLCDTQTMHFGPQLAQRGYVVLAPDYLNSGDYRFDPYAHGYVSATMKGIRNHMRAVDLLCSLPEVDAGRIGVMGHSLGGHNSIFVALFDPRIRAVISSCGFNAFGKYYGGKLAGWSHEGYMPRIASQCGADPARVPFDWPELIGALAPRPLFVNAPVDDSNFEVSGVHDCIRAALPVYRLLGRPNNLMVAYPKSGHDFPDGARMQAYEWLKRQLGKAW